MSDVPKFRFRSPQNTEERIEAIYDELSSSPRLRNGTKPVDTLKDAVGALLQRARDWERASVEAAEKITNEKNWALGALAALAAVFLFNGWSGSRDWEWLNQNRFAVRLWGVAFAAVYVGVSIEQTSFFRSLWSFAFTKLVASISFSALLLFSTGKASSLVNGVFGVDASAFPFTRAFMAGFVAFDYLSIFLIVVAAFAIAHALNAIGFIHSRFNKGVSYSRAPWSSLVFLSIALAFLLFSWRWLGTDFSEAELPTKTYRLARLLDFNSKHLCSNLPPGISVVYIGPEQARVLVDTTEVVTSDVESFVNRDFSDQVRIPEKFYLLPCQPGSSWLTR
jgi:hypothetical protein